MRRAVIDIGSNTVKLLVADVHDTSLSVVNARDAATRLGEQATISGQLSAVAIDRTLVVIKEFVSAARAAGAVEIAAVATSAVREAGNTAEFCAAVRRECGVDVQVISGAREAELVFHGVASAPEWSGQPILVVDVGGGSAEIIEGCRGAVARRTSLPLGAVRLSERFGDDQFPGLCEHVRTVLYPALSDFDRTRRVVGTGGTLVTLARVALGRVEGAAISEPDLRRLVLELNAMTLAERRAVPRMPADRADIIVAGGMVYLTALEALGAHEITVSTRNLRYGVLLNGSGIAEDAE